ncbi:hypothetical protein SAY86_024844 [Trapa natans]|uniref:CDT1 Geminin-binding domain-containing protein n=1 Tax=Trapa natans TaxID=22666 RepID=A0AAN7M5X1_TRANT|nr:hypothetical protein SAY86_024844 [Trapa natans]
MEEKQSKKSSGTVRSMEESNITLQTPQKTSEPLRVEPKLLERYKIIEDFFNKMICSLRLLNLCKKLPTFRNVSSQVEVLAKRKFQYRHLAQIKYLLPETIQIDKYLIHDKETLCMIPDVKITLLFDGIDVHPEHSRVVAVSKLFASRLEDFVSTHPEDCDVPEAMLPKIFNQNSQDSTLEDAGWGYGVQPQPTSEVGILLEVIGASHHFRKHFSDKAVVSDSKKTSLLISQSPHLPSACEEAIKSRHENGVDSLCAESDAVDGQTIDSMQDDSTPEGFPGVPSSSNYSCLISNGLSIGCESPIVKVSSSAKSLLIETPAHLTPKRAILNDDNCKKSMDNKVCSSCQKPTKRSLAFSVEGEDSTLNFPVGESDPSEPVVPCISTCATVPVTEPEISNSVTVSEKVQERHIKDHSSSKTRSGMCQQMSSMPGTVAVIDVIFRARGWSCITKEELVYEIMTNNLDIVERREVEEQVEHLEKMVPDWIHRISAPSGDIMYSVKRESDILHILSRLIST